MPANNQKNGTTPPPHSGTGKNAAMVIKDAVEKFKIPASMAEKYPELIALIMGTESMQDEERRYWFSILSVMTEDQVEKLREILLNEREQLRKLDEEYAKELNKINQTQLTKYKGMEIKERFSKIRSSESKAEEEEKAHEEEMLKKLNEL